METRARRSKTATARSRAAMARPMLPRLKGYRH